MPQGTSRVREAFAPVASSNLPKNARFKVCYCGQTLVFAASTLKVHAEDTSIYGLVRVRKRNRTQHSDWCERDERNGKTEINVTFSLS